MSNKTIHLIGFGSQGSAWAQCLRKSGWEVKVYLARKGPSFKKALEQGFEPLLISDLPSRIKIGSSTKWIAMLCVDSAIAPLYEEYLAHLDCELRLILAHGFAVYTGDLQFKNPKHQATLLAPKAIGPKLSQNFLENFPNPHRLSAAFHCAPTDQEDLIQIARGIGFDKNALIPATFQQETVGDLISEQGLLCGGVFNLLDWTVQSMQETGIPEALIREECLTELELIAGLIRERGPAEAFRSISQAAQCGTMAMANCLQDSGFKTQFRSQMEDVKNGKFTRFFKSQDWQTQAKELAERLERNLPKKSS